SPRTSIAYVQFIESSESRAPVDSHAEFPPLESPTKTSKRVCVTASKKDDLVAAVFTMDGDYSFRVSDEIQTSRLIEASARDVQSTIVAWLGALEGIEREIRSGNRLPNLRCSGLYSTSMQ